MVGARRRWGSVKAVGVCVSACHGDSWSGWVDIAQGVPFDKLRTGPDEPPANRVRGWAILET